MMAGMNHHAIDYIELSVTDMDAAKAFYASAFDWSFNDYGPGYQGIRHGDGESGGSRDLLHGGDSLPTLSP